MTSALADRRPHGRGREAYTDVFTAVRKGRSQPEPNNHKKTIFHPEQVLHPHTHIGIVRLPLSGCLVI